MTPRRAAWALAGWLLCQLPAMAAGTVTLLPGLGGDRGGASSINDAGQIVGWADLPDESIHPTRWDNGVPTDLAAGSLGGGVANKINQAGVAVGYSFTPNGPVLATVWHGGSAVVLDTPVGFESMASSINKAGLIVGSVYVTLWTEARLWSSGTATELANLGFVHTGALDINDDGQMAGWAIAPGGETRATVWRDGIATGLGTLGGPDSLAWGLNRAGQVVGSADLADGSRHAALWQDGVITDLGNPASAYSGANDINDSGQIVGLAAPTIADDGRAMLWQDGLAIDLNDFLDPTLAASGWVLRMASGINESGSIVGDAFNIHDRAYRAFLYTPSAVPEPASSALMLAGLAGVAALAVRRRRSTARQG